MTFTFEVLVSLKAGPGRPGRQGRDVRAAGAGVDERLAGQRGQAHADRRGGADRGGGARAQVEEMAARLLSNPVIEDFRILETEEA